MPVYAFHFEQELGTLLLTPTSYNLSNTTICSNCLFHLIKLV